jgi:hypothetical protein
MRGRGGFVGEEAAEFTSSSRGPPKHDCDVLVHTELDQDLPVTQLPRGRCAIMMSNASPESGGGDRFALCGNDFDGFLALGIGLATQHKKASAREY